MLASDSSLPFRVVLKSTASAQLHRLPVTAFHGVQRALHELAASLGRGLHAVEGAVHHLELAGRVPAGVGKLRYLVDAKSRTMVLVELGR